MHRKLATLATLLLACSSPQVAYEPTPRPPLEKRVPVQSIVTHRSPSERLMLQIMKTRTSVLRYENISNPVMSTYITDIALVLNNVRNEDLQHMEPQQRIDVTNALYNVRSIVDMYDDVLRRNPGEKKA